MKSEKYLLAIIQLLFTNIISSCDNLIEIDPPRDQLGTEYVFESEETTNSAIMGLYSTMINPSLSFASGGITQFTGLSSDEFYYSTPNSNDVFTMNSLNPGNSAIQGLWQRAYQYIYHANTIIEGVNKSASLSTDFKNKIKGEALFIRAFCHFYLVSLYGPVPVITTTEYQNNTSTERKPEHEVYLQIENDLNKAQQLMDGLESIQSRPGIWAVKALLARVSLYSGKYLPAIEISSDIINSGNFELLSDLNAVFKSGSAESIWQLVPVALNVNTWEGNFFVPDEGTLPVCLIRDSLLEAFGEQDFRKRDWIGNSVVNESIYFFPNKYKVRTGEEKIEYYTIFRFAEIYLIRAEALAQLDHLNDAIQDINIIRQRAGLEMIEDESLSKDMVLDIIFEERRKELFAEWGHRWFDLKRSGKIHEVLRELKGDNWQETDLLFPIPAVEIERNPSLTQNAGY